MAIRVERRVIVEIWQYGEVIFKGNSDEVKEHFGINDSQFNTMRASGRAFQAGKRVKPSTRYALKVGMTKKVIEINFNNRDSNKNILPQDEQEDMERRNFESKEERRMRRKIQREHMLANLHRND